MKVKRCKKTILGAVIAASFAGAAAFNINAGINNSGNADVTLPDIEVLARTEVQFCSDDSVWGTCDYTSFLNFDCTSDAVKDCGGTYTKDI